MTLNRSARDAWIKMGLCSWLNEQYPANCFFLINNDEFKIKSRQSDISVNVFQPNSGWL